VFSHSSSTAVHRLHSNLFPLYNRYFQNLPLSSCTLFSMKKKFWGSVIIRLCLGRLNILLWSHQFFHVSGRREMCTKFSLENLEGTDHSEDLGLDGKVIWRVDLS
jgi:hypothetical protein